MDYATSPTVSFGIFDHLDHAGGSLRQQYNDRLEIAAACDEAGFRAYHVSEHHGTPHGLAAAPNLFLSSSPTPIQVRSQARRNGRASRKYLRNRQQKRNGRSGAAARGHIPVNPELAFTAEDRLAAMLDGIVDG